MLSICSYLACVQTGYGARSVSPPHREAAIVVRSTFLPGAAGEAFLQTINGTKSVVVSFTSPRPRSDRSELVHSWGGDLILWYPLIAIS